MADRTPQELAEALNELASREWDDPDCPATDSLTGIVREAANLLSGLEGREEYSYKGGACTYECELVHVARGAGDRVIQKRQVFEFATPWETVSESEIRAAESPWTDIEEEG